MYGTALKMGLRPGRLVVSTRQRAVADTVTGKLAWIQAATRAFGAVDWER